jgi:hypothetical protein
MLWEFERYNWGSLRAMGPAGGIPQAIIQLVCSTSISNVVRAYWQIDNLALVQGSLYEAALPTAACLVVALQTCSPIARPKLLELLAQIGLGTPDPSEIQAGNKNLLVDCIREIRKGAAVYLYYLQHGNRDERLHCIDLLGICAGADSDLRDQVLWYLKRQQQEEQDPAASKLITNWIADIQGIDS